MVVLGTSFLTNDEEKPSFKKNEKAIKSEYLRGLFVLLQTNEVTWIPPEVLNVLKEIDDDDLRLIDVLFKVETEDSSSEEEVAETSGNAYQGFEFVVLVLLFLKGSLLQESFLEESDDSRTANKEDTDDNTVVDDPFLKDKVTMGLICLRDLNRVKRSMTAHKSIIVSDQIRYFDLTTSIIL